MKTFLKSKAFIISAVALGVVIGGATAVAHFGDERRHITGRLVDKLDAKVSLSDAQRAQVERVIGEAMQTLGDNRESRADSVAALLNQPQLTADEVQVAIDARRAGDMRDERDVVIADAVARVHAILNPTQRAELAEWFEDRVDDGWLRGRGGHRHHRGFGHRWLH